MQTEVRSSLGPRLRVQIKFPEKGRTKQSFRKECDINLIMSRYVKTGQIQHLNFREAKYDFASSRSFTESMQIMKDADALFSDLPAIMRARFGNNPKLFLEFVENPANRPEMADLGLLSEEATLALQTSKDAISVASELPANDKLPSSGAKPAKEEPAHVPT